MQNYVGNKRLKWHIHTRKNTICHYKRILTPRYICIISNVFIRIRWRHGKVLKIFDFKIQVQGSIIETDVSKSNNVDRLIEYLLVFWWKDKERWIWNYWDFLFLIKWCHLCCLQFCRICFLCPCTKIKRFPPITLKTQNTYSFSSFSLFSSSSLSAVPFKIARAKASLSRCFCSSASALSFSASSA